MGSAASVAEPIVSALDPQGQPIHQRIRQLFPGIGIDLLHGGAPHLHPFAALLLGEPLLVDETDSLVLIHRQDDRRFSALPVLRGKQ